MNNWWTEERTESLRKMFAEKMSASEIANALGAYSRNAVCGKLARLGLMRGFGTRHPSAPATKRARARKPKMVNFNRVEAARGRLDPEPFVCRDAADVAPRHLTLLELEEGDCRFPYGEVSYTFCGNLVREGSPYCPAHSRLCYLGIPTPKRAPYVERKGTGGVFGRAA